MFAEANNKANFQLNTNMTEQIAQRGGSLVLWTATQRGRAQTLWESLALVSCFSSSLALNKSQLPYMLSVLNRLTLTAQ